MNKITASSLLLVLQKVLERSLGLISTIILARILSPEDFGLIAAAMLVFWLVKTLTKAGTGSYIMQKEFVSNAEINSAWTLDLILKNGSYFLLVLSSPLVAYLYGNFQIVPIVVSIGLVLVIGSFSNPGLMLLKRDQNYKSIVKRDVSAKVVGIAVVIPAALYLQNYWAIVAGQLVTTLYSCVLSYQISSYRPAINKEHIATQWQFSKWLIPQAVVGYFRTYIDTIILGLRFSVGDLGAYNNMKYFASMPMLQFLTPLVAPLHREMGKVQNKPDEMRFQSDITIKLLGFLIAPIATVFYISSEQIIFIILGSQWVEYHEIFGYLGLMIIPFVLFTQSNRVLMVKSLTKTIFKYEILATFFISLFLFTIPAATAVDFSIYKVLLELFLSSCLYFYSYKVVFKSSGISNYLFVLLPFLIVIFFVYFFVDIFAQYGAIMSLLLTGFLSLIFTIIVFGMFYFILASKKEREMVASVLRSLKS